MRTGKFVDKFLQSQIISERICSISVTKEVDGGTTAREAETVATEGMATSMSLSANSASLFRVVSSGVGASTMRTF